MTTLASPATGDLQKYFQLLQEGIAVRRHFDLLMWLQGDVQRYLPHEIMVAAWGDFNLGLVHHDIVSALPGVRTEHASSATLTPLLRGLFDRWIALGKKPYTLDAGESGFLMHGGGIDCALGGALKEMRSSIVHGISDERGRHDCLYVIFSSAATHGDGERGAMEMLLPYIDTALRQVTHLPRQQQEHAEPAAAAAAPGTEDHGLSGREQEIMDWVRQGKTNQEIAIILDISAFTVKNHLQRIFKKLGVFNRTQAVTRYEKANGNGGK